MRPGTFLLSIGLALALLIAVAFRAAHARGRAEAEAAVLAGQTANLEAEAGRLEQASAATRRARAQASAVPERPRVHSAAVRRPSVNPAVLIRQNPKLQVLDRAARQARIGEVYGPLFAALHLSPAQAEKFAGLMIEHQDQMEDVREEADARGLAPSDPAIAALLAQADRSQQEAERQLLGEPGYAQAQQYVRALPVQPLVEQVAGAVAFTAPLTAAQGEKLTQALAAASASYQKGGAASTGDIDWDQADQAAVAFLSSAQLAFWQQAEPMGGGVSRWMVQLGDRLNRAGPPGGGTSHWVGVLNR